MEQARFSNVERRAGQAPRLIVIRNVVQPAGRLGAQFDGACVRSIGEHKRSCGGGDVAGVDGDGAGGGAFDAKEDGGGVEDARGGDENFGGVHETQGRFGRGICLGGEIEDRRVVDFVEDYGGAKIGGGDFEADVVEGQAMNVAGKEAVGGDGAEGEVF